jgi:flagellar hook assembly protein FlgD
MIYYQLEENGWMTNITIFDASGKQIKRLYKSQLLSIKGLFLWDGTTDTNRPANMGIYVIFVEMFNVNIGETKRYKFACVLSGK